MKEHFINELKRLLDSVCSQGARVESIIRQASDAFASLNPKLATKLIQDDAVIDEEEVHIEEECLKILALYQPVASDLRMVIALLKINTALERMADFGVHIAERVIKLNTLVALNQEATRINFLPMVDVVLSMLSLTMKVISSSDTSLAIHVIEADDQVDLFRHQNSNAARDLIHQYPDFSDYYVECLNISRELERIADINVDICKHILYLQSGRIMRHVSSYKL